METGSIPVPASNVSSGLRGIVAGRWKTSQQTSQHSGSVRDAFVVHPERLRVFRDSNGLRWKRDAKLPRRVNNLACGLETLSTPRDKAPEIRRIAADMAKDAGGRGTGELSNTEE